MLFISVNSLSTSMFVKKNFILFASCLRTYLCISCLYEAMEKLSEIITVRVRETTISSDEGFNGTFVNRAMPSFHVALLEITRTLPLNIKNICKKWEIWMVLCPNCPSLTRLELKGSRIETSSLTSLSETWSREYLLIT